MRRDMQDSQWFRGKVRASDAYAQNLYAAICNMQWQKIDVMPILREDYWTASWRAAGGIVADLRGEGDYLDWYCSGMGGSYDYHEDQVNLDEKGYVAEGTVTDEIREDLKKIGWQPVSYPRDK